jgi:hypothetical protein
MLATKTAVLLELQLVWSVPLVLCRRVVALLALSAGKSHDIAHLIYPRRPARQDRAPVIDES